MANWWDAAPLADAKTTAQPAAGANWWEAAPLANEATSGGVRTETAADGRPRVIMDMSTKKPDRGAVDAAGRGIANGLTANFYDELRGLIEANGVDPKEPGGLYNLIGGAVKYWSGDKEAEKRYNAAVTRERGLNKDTEEQHPIASVAGNIAGAVALPIGAMGQAATLPGRMAAGAGVGAAFGGASGAGEGDGTIDRVSRGVTGAAIGGALGGAAPAVIEGVIQGGRAAVQPIANTLRGIRTPDDEAARRVALSIQRDMQVDPNAASRLTPQEFSTSRQQGGPATIMDIGGETTRALARSAANTSPEGRAALGRTINDRFEGQAARLTDHLGQTYNYPDATLIEQALKQAAKSTNGPAYQKVMNAHPVVSVPSEITDRPAVAQAMKDAISLARNYGEKLEAPAELRTILSGPGFHIADDVPNPAKTSLRYWDYVKKALDARIEGAKRSGGIEDLNSKQKADFAGLVDAKNTLVTHLDKVAEGYKDARAGAAAFFGAENALEAGQKILTSKMRNTEVAQGLAKMSPGERKLAQDGFVSEYTAMLKETGDRRSALNKIADSPAARQRLHMVLGPEKAAELEAKLRVEGIMDLARNAVQGNSTTARQLAELGLAGGTYGFSGGGVNPVSSPSALMNAALVYGAARGHSRINENVSRRVAEMLTSNDPATLLRGIRTVTRSQNLFNSLRATDRGLARIGGDQAPTGMLSLSGVSRADDQPDGPRKPN